jgi:hypothetical protein
MHTAVDSSRVVIAPTILTSDASSFMKSLELYSTFAKRLQIDIVDGSFVATTTISESEITNLPTGVLIDMHMMVARPSAPSVRRKLARMPLASARISVLVCVYDMSGRVRSRWRCARLSRKSGVSGVHATPFTRLSTSWDMSDHLPGTGQAHPYHVAILVCLNKGA